MKSMTRWGVVAAAASLLLAACGSSTPETAEVSDNWDEVVAAAKSEGSVLLYSSHNPANLELLKTAFAKKYPDIKLEVVRATDAELNPKVEVEAKTGKGAADVHMLTDAKWLKAARESGTYSVDLIGPELKSEAYQAEGALVEGKFALTSVAAFTLGWNTDALPDGFGDVTDVIKPELKGKIGIVNPAGIATYVDLYRYWEETYGQQFLEDLAALEPRIYPSALGIAQALTSGEIVAAPLVNALVNEVESGAPVDWKMSSKPWGAPWYTHALKSAPHPNAAQVLVDFIASLEGQTALGYGYATTVPGIEGAIADAADVTFADPSDLTTEDINTRQAAWEKLFLRK